MNEFGNQVPTGYYEMDIAFLADVLASNGVLEFWFYDSYGDGRFGASYGKNPTTINSTPSTPISSEVGYPATDGFGGASAADEDESWFGF